jgi:hypothetical protein
MLFIFCFAPKHTEFKLSPQEISVKPISTSTILFNLFDFKLQVKLIYK